MDRKKLNFNPVRFIVFGNGPVGYKIMRYSQDISGVDLVGFVEKESSSLLSSAEDRKMPLYASDKEAFERMRKEGHNPIGVLDDLLAKDFDFAIDATDKQVYFRNKVAAAASIKVPIIGQGNLEAEEANISVSSLTNLDSLTNKAILKRLRLAYIIRPRKVSCNTTGASKVIYVAQRIWGLRKNEDGKHYHVFLVRRASDRGKPGINGLEYSTDPHKQHHAADIDTVLSSVTGDSDAVMGMHKRMHLQILRIYLKKTPKSKQEVRDVYKNMPRIKVLEGNIDDSDKVAEHFSRSGRIMEDFPENVITSIQYLPKSNSIKIVQYIDNVSIVCPENIDMMIKMKNPDLDKRDIMHYVDSSLEGILPGFARPQKDYRRLK